MDISAAEGRITVMLAEVVYASHVALSTYSMCLFCMLQCCPDIKRRLCSLLDNKTLPLTILKCFPSLSIFYYQQFIIQNSLDKTQRLKYEINQQQQTFLKVYKFGRLIGVLRGSLKLVTV